MNASAPDAKKRPDPEQKSAVVARLLKSQRLRRWLWRIAITVTVLSTIGHFSNPSVSPLMCKVYG